MLQSAGNGSSDPSAASSFHRNSVALSRFMSAHERHPISEGPNEVLNEATLLLILDGQLGMSGSIERLAGLFKHLVEKTMAERENLLAAVEAANNATASAVAALNAKDAQIADLQAQFAAASGGVLTAAEAQSAADALNADATALDTASGAAPAPAPEPAPVDPSAEPVS